MIEKPIPQAEQTEAQHFTKIFWFGLFNVAMVFAYLFMITFIPVPKDNQRFVDISIGLLLGTVFGNVLGFFYGGSSQLAKKPVAPSSPGTTTADISATITTEPDKKETS